MHTNLPPPVRHRLLVAEDDQALRELMVQLLCSDGYEVMAVTTGIELLKSLQASLDSNGRAEKFDLVISDVRMPGSSGLRVLEQLSNRSGVPPVVFVTAFGDEELHQHAHRLGAIAVLDKPIDFDELRDFVKSYLAGEQP